MKRAAYACLLILALLAGHVWYWYLPRERAAAPRLGAAGGGVAEPLQLLAGGAYDVCLWLPYPHQNLGVLAAAIGDPQDLIEAAVRLTADLSGNAANAGNAGDAGEIGKEAAARRAREPEELPTFGPFQVPPASELVACADLAGGRLRVVARIYPALAVVAKLAGRLAGNPWLAGGAAGNTRVTWSGRLWSATAGEELPPAAVVAAGAPVPAGATQDVALPESLAVVHWTGARQEIPAGYYALTRRGSDLALSLVGAGGGAGAGGPRVEGAAVAIEGAIAAGTGDAAGTLLAGAGPIPALLLAVGPEGRGRMADDAGTSAGEATAGGRPGIAATGGNATGAEIAARGSTPGSGRDSAADTGRSAPPAPLPPAALALFEASGLRITSLGDLPGVAVFNAASAAGAARWRLPTEGLFRLLGGRLPTAESAGWRILALDPDSLRQAAALAPRLAALVPPGGPAGGTSAPGGAAAGPPLSLGVWLEPRTALRIVSRVRRFVDGFPLASRRQVELWRDWETVLEPLANCGGATLTATAAPPTMRLLMRDCTAAGPR